ncbi:T9SS type B sorting domain-containing protein [Kordia jejudonensis]|uniref:T9SS type B sorting domain-containing protein n=1 Tax=Kordia jejudonensis TaxID=1348245 RepID=UPI0006294FEF|nr:T9SS C-terminal target domain-containing protein [Kordia jejudonensis]
MKRKFLLLVFITFNIFHCFSQGQTNIWYFGENAGLDFSSGTPVAIFDGQIDTDEGCATISDENGNLLLYTDGITVWDTNHNIMPNGQFLQGNSSSSQSGIIVPFPNDTTKYYIFCVDHNASDGGLYYSVVDLTLNGGNGDVVPGQKNILLLARSAEKIAAISDGNDGFWVVSYASPTGNTGTYDTFHAYHITSTGIDTNSVRSTYSGCATNDGRGYLKISPDGTKIVICNQEQTHVCLHNFDVTTGDVSPEISQLNTINSPYCAEFSASSDRMYVSAGQFSTTTTYLHQFDLTAPNISATRVQLHSAVEQRAALQLAIDGKIYFARPNRNFLGVINNPEALGTAANYVNNGVDLGTRTSTQGLPPFIQSLFLVGIEFEGTCLGDATQFVMNTNSEDVTAILWDFGDGNTSTLENPSHTYATVGSYDVTVTLTTPSSTTSNTATVIISNPPIVNTISDYLICDDTVNDGITLFDLTTKEPEVLAGQAVGDVFNLSYHINLDDADNSSNPLPTAYTNAANPEEVFVRIEHADNPDCYAVTSFNLIVFESPTTETIADINICDDLNDGEELIDLSLLTDQVLGTQSNTVFEVFYYDDPTDADMDINRLPTNYLIQNTSQTIYARKENMLHDTCFSIINFTVLLQTQFTANPVNDLIVCDDVSNDDSEVFDLTVQNNLITNGQTGSFTIRYYRSQADADARTNEIAANFANETNPQEIFARIENTVETDCYDTTSFNLIVFESPTTETIADINICDNLNDVQELIDLSQFTDQVLGTQSDTLFEVFYYVDPTDAANDTNRLLTNYFLQNTSQIIYARKENNLNTDCFSVTSFTLFLQTQFTANAVGDLIVCDDVSNDGTEVFNLAVQNDFVANGQTGSFAIRYYTSQADADARTNEITASFSNETNPQEIFVRIENTVETDCYDTTSFFIEVKDVPNVNTDEIIAYVCTNESVVISADAGYDEYVWSTGETTQEITVTEAGIYTVTVITNYNSLPAVSCSNTQTIRVIESDEAIITNVEIQDWTLNNNQIEIFVEGIGDYEYSIDGFNYQDSPVFTNLLVGSMVAYVRDKNGCGVVTQDVNLLFYPSFFTPNNDGFNDYWQIISSEFEPDLKIHIFDRFGKLLTILKPESQGWDGTYHGRRLPSTDYWFMVERPSNNERYTGHFTLKR